MLNFIQEIRNRFILVFIIGVSCFVILYLYKETILCLIIKIFQKSFFDIPTFNFLSTNITEIFLVFINLIKLSCLQILSLYSLYHLFLFFSPALYKAEYTTLKKTFFNAIRAWFVSIVIVNYLMVPLSWNFFYSFQATPQYTFLDFYFEAKISEYLSFYETIYYIVLFYVESFALLMTFFHFVNNKIFFIKKHRKIYHYTFFIISTLTSPPDVFSQLCIFFLVLALFEVFVLTQILKIKVS